MIEKTEYVNPLEFLPEGCSRRTPSAIKFIKITENIYIYWKRNPIELLSLHLTSPKIGKQCSTPQGRNPYPQPPSSHRRATPSLPLKRPPLRAMSCIYSTWATEETKFTEAGSERRKNDREGKVPTATADSTVREQMTRPRSTRSTFRMLRWRSE